MTGVLRCMRDRARNICHLTRCNRKWTTFIRCSRQWVPRKPGEEDPNNPFITSPRKIPRTRTTGWCTQDTVHPLHQGAKWEDWEGLCKLCLTCKQLTKTLGSKRPAVDWLIVVYCSSVNFANGIAVHVQKTDYRTNWEGATVRRAEGFLLRRTVEAIQIRKATLNMNLDSDLLLPMVWNPILPHKPPPPNHLAPFCLVYAWSLFMPLILC